MTGMRTPQQNTTSLTHAESDLLRHFRNCALTAQIRLVDMVESYAQHYPAREKPQLRLVKSTSLTGGAHA